VIQAAHKIAARKPEVASRAEELVRKYEHKIREHKPYVIEHGVDPPELRDWYWGKGTPTTGAKR